MSRSRLKIWCAFLDRATLSFSKGDSIGEMRILRMLSEFADVYYNGQLARPGDREFGRGETIETPNDEYDLYYVRANNELFLKLPHPKVCMAYPYDKVVFEAADGLVVTTDIWKRIITDMETRARHRDFFDKWYPEDAVFPDGIIQFRQIVDPDFGGGSLDRRQVNAWRFRLTNADVLGFYGRLAKDALPYTVMEALALMEEETRPVLAFGGRFRQDLREEPDLLAKHLYIGAVDYTEMPKLLSATFCTLAGESVDDRVLGSNKILDSISVGTPVICKRNPVRDEYLGADYPGLFTNTEEAADRINSLLSDGAFRKRLKDETINAAQNNSVKHAGAFTEKEISGLLSR